MFKGTYTALVTPFKEGDIDWPALDNLIEWQIEQGIHGLVISGTTGEAPTLSVDEHKRIVERSIAVVKGRIPIMVGTGTNVTKTTIEKTRHAQNAGADAALVVTPYYNKPTQEGLYEHYREIAQNTDVPIVIYNIPGRTGVDMATETISRLTQFENIIGIKDSTGDLGRINEIQKKVGSGFTQLCGEDPLTFSYLEQGGHGCISVTSNIAPSLCSAVYNYYQKGKTIDARDLSAALSPIHSAMFYETSPQPVKYALFRMGLCSDEMRLPMVRASQECRIAVDRAIDTLNEILHEQEEQSQATG